MNLLQKLVNQVRAARDAGNPPDKEKSIWFDIEDAINELPDLPPSDRVRLRNVLYEHLESQTAGSPDIDIDEVKDFIRRNPDAGKDLPEKEKVRWIPY